MIKFSHIYRVSQNYVNLIIIQYFAHTVRAYIDNTFPRLMNRSRGTIALASIDSTLCDFWLWSMVKASVHAKRIREINDLKPRIQTVVSLISREISVRVLNATVAPWFCVLDMMANRLRLTCKSSSGVCFLNKCFD